MADAIRRTLGLEIEEKQDDGGRIRISSIAVDRDKDRVIPAGARVDNYMRNPVVQWGHNYREPWATVGLTNDLSITDVDIVAEFELREPANDVDPQNIVLLLWRTEMVKAASIGFIPERWEENDLGGRDFNVWELLEWSLTPIPSNQQALRLAAKALQEQDDATVRKDLQAIAASFKRGRVLSARNEQRIRSAVEALQKVLSELGEDDDDDEKAHVQTRIAKGVVPRDVSRQTAPEDTEWSAPTASDFASASFNELSASERRRIAGHFGWTETSPPEAYQQLKLPHHRPSDGYVIWRGVAAAMAALLGARGGVDIPNDDRRPVYNHLVSHYEQFDKEPPELRSYEEHELKEISESYADIELDDGRSVPADDDDDGLSAEELAAVTATMQLLIAEVKHSILAGN